MDDKEAVPPSLPETLRRIGAAALAIFQNRLELLVVELHEDRIRLFEALLLLVAIVALGLLTLMLAVAGVIALVWHHFGVPGLFILSGIGLLATLLVCWRLHLRLKDWPLLPGTMEQLKKDRECLENK
ncbi:MAG TPA: phage holin family protein [Candidatus Sulfotelmatobacter sp.]|nr:phage holin family protein [Candidatus Sulfotelmatobacter sp.]